jgi:hypothetical protein
MLPPMAAPPPALQIIQELQIEGLRELFLALPEDPVAREGRLGLVAANRIERLLDRVVAAIVRGPARTTLSADPAGGPAEPAGRLQAAE